MTTPGAREPEGPRARSGGFSVVVLSCGDLGIEVANRIDELEPVTSVLLVTAPFQRRPRTLVEKLRLTWRAEGPPGIVRAVMGRLLPRNADGAGRPADRPPRPSSGVRHLRVTDFHDPGCLEAMAAAEPDLGVLAGTYILAPEVFSIPRLGSINLHSGKVPEYRGAAPAFWELFHGESEIGITIHEVVEHVDAGRIFRQEVFPFDPVPSGDPLAYVERVRAELLRPEGIRLLAAAVEDIAEGRADPRPQDPARARTFRSPDYRAKRELRRRVRRRRKGA